MSRRFKTLVSAVLAFVAIPAHASLVTTSFGGTVVNFSQFGSYVAVDASATEVGALVGESISLRSSNLPLAGLSFNTYGLADNGQWTNAGRQGYAALNNTLGVPGKYLEFTFNAGAVGSVGGFINYAICTGQECSPAQHVIIEAFDTANTVVESYDLTALAPISTPGQVDAGAFRGIVRSSRDIAKFRLYNAGNVIDDLAFARNAVPAPGSLALVVGALGAMGALRRRRTACRNLLLTPAVYHGHSVGAVVCSPCDFHEPACRVAQRAACTPVVKPAGWDAVEHVPVEG